MPVCVTSDYLWMSYVSKFSYSVKFCVFLYLLGLSPAILAPQRIMMYFVLVAITAMA